MEDAEKKKISRTAKKTKLCRRCLYLGVGLVLLLIAARLVFCAFNFSVVYLQTGDIYFGRFLPFPFYVVFDAWVMQRDQLGQPFLSKVESMIWQPKNGMMKLNPRLIVFHTLLSSESVVMKAINSQTTDVSVIPLFSPLASPSQVPSSDQ